MSDNGSYSELQLNYLLFYIFRWLLVEAAQFITLNSLCHAPGECTWKVLLQGNNVTFLRTGMCINYWSSAKSDLNTINHYGEDIQWLNHVFCFICLVGQVFFWFSFEIAFNVSGLAIDLEGVMITQGCVLLLMIAQPEMLKN